VTKTPLKDPIASIRQRLLNHAKAYDDNYQRILTRYAIERLLFRLSQTDARDRYVLKGAMLFVTWPEQAFRPTGDLDLLGQGDPNPAAITELFTRICRVAVPEDGVIFDPATLAVEAVREEEKYQGVRVTLRGRLGTAVIPVQVDIGFGDQVYPPPRRQTFPSLLPELPAADILMYPPETVVAEKFEAMVRFAEENGRIKDFHDLWIITRTFPFDLSTLAEAVGGTLRRRETATPTETPVALNGAFADRPDKQALWSGFLRRTPPALPPPAFDEVLAELRGFFGPLLAALALPESARGRWNPARREWE
jgi:hypothetical protein